MTLRHLGSLGSTVKDIMECEKSALLWRKFIYENNQILTYQQCYSRELSTRFEEEKHEQLQECQDIVKLTSTTHTILVLHIF